MIDKRQDHLVYTSQKYKYLDKFSMRKLGVVHCVIYACSVFLWLLVCIEHKLHQ